MSETLGTVHMRGRGLLRGWWWPVGPKLVFFTRRQLQSQKLWIALFTGTYATEMHLAEGLIFAWWQKWKVMKSLIEVVGICKRAVWKMNEQPSLFLETIMWRKAFGTEVLKDLSSAAIRNLLQHKAAVIPLTLSNRDEWVNVMEFQVTELY
jgi:hypothetical protein